MEVDFTVEQEYNLEILKEAKLLEFTLWVFIELANKSFGLEFRLIQTYFHRRQLP